MADEKVRTPLLRRARAVDVAEHAGVSTATVSLVVNGKADGRVSPDLQDRVKRAVNELGYVVNRSASSLVTGRRSCVALVAKDLTNPVMSLIASGVSEVLGEDTQLLLAVTGPEEQASDLSRVAAFGVDGILLHAPTTEQLAQVPDHTPTVLLDYLPRAKRQYARVAYDTSTGSLDLAHHLVEHGHQRMVYLDSVRPLATFDRRRQALITEFTRLAPHASVDWARSGWSVEAVRTLVLEAWSTWHADGTTVIVAATDVQAYGALAALEELGVGVPDEVSVASFDNLPFSSLMTPSLTAVDLPAATLGRVGAKALLELIGHKGHGVPQAIQLPTELIVRKSTGPARRP
ncbi:LacI family DNA-binding transcriptional regulator [Herbiconiux sp. P17]|uniref:LacI family DNA-binding transcriptional regulator n=1 Tax=Herbiconiux wuyangfengii TaxID=3342794 RepID=UPI0035BB45C9